MSEVVPEDRIRGTLGELLSLKYGKSLPAAIRDASGSVPVFGSSGVVGKHSSALTTGPTIIVGRKGNVGAVHFSAVPCWPIDTAYFVEPPAGHSATYYRYLLTSLNLVRLDKSTAIPGLSRDDYNAVEVAVHAPAQQIEIVSELEKQFSRLDEAVANLQRVKANLKRYKAAVLKAAVEGRLVETEATLARREGRTYETGEQLLQRILAERRGKWAGKGKYKEPVAPDTACFSALPAGWVWTSGDQLTSVITDGEHITPRRTSEGVLLLSARNVLNGRLALDDVDYVPEDEYERIAKRIAIQAGDVLLSCSGTVGRSCVVPTGLRFTLVRSVAVLRPVIVLADFMTYNLQSPLGQSQIDDRKTQTAQANLFQGKIRQLVFALPPLAEQARIVAEVDRHLSIIREVEAEVDANLLRAQALRQATLAKAFEHG